MNEFKTITTQDLKEKLDRGEDLLLIDVLPADSYRQNHLPGAINISVGEDDLVEQVEEKAGGDKDQEIVVYCNSPECLASPGAAQKLTKAGFNNVLAYEGGILEWQQAGLELEGEVN